MANSVVLKVFIVLGTCVISSLAQVDGNWGTWNNWQDCTASCAGGVRIRLRECNDPPPSSGGDDCPGYGSQTGACNTQGCPVDGSWTEFSDWSDCTVTCGGGTQTRTRSCSNPTPANGGTMCTGEDTETLNCGDVVCPTDGKWTSWGSWTNCNNECDSFRYRTCTNPAPANGGRQCGGRSREVYECSIEDCPVDGQWGAWTFHSCDRTCRGFKTRRCDDPPPIRGGKVCVGTDREQYGECTGHECVENGNWGLWSPWSKCSKTCMHGTQTRTRRCNHPAPRNGGKECPVEDESEQHKPCYLQTCPVPPDYVRKVKNKKNDINFGLILGTIFGSMAAITILLVLFLSIRKHQLKKQRDKIVEERENSKLYKDAAEMSIIPEGKRSAEARLRRKQLKSKLKRNGKLNEETPLMLMGEEGFDMDEFDDDDRPWSSMSSRPGSAVSRPGTARLRPSAYGREGSTLSREDSELDREVTLMDIFQDADYLKRKNTDDPLAREETSFFDTDGVDGTDTGLYRSDTQMSFQTGLAPDSKKAQRSLLETPRPESTRPDEEYVERVPTPMMMKGLEELDQQLRNIAGYATDGQDTSIPGGIGNLAELLGSNEGGKDNPVDTLGLPMNLQNQEAPRGPGVAVPSKGGAVGGAAAAAGGMSLNNAMNKKVVIAQINHIPSNETPGAGGGGLPNLQSAMSKKAGAKGDISAPPPTLPNQDVFSRHSSLPNITPIPAAPSVTKGDSSFDEILAEQQEAARIKKHRAANPLNFEELMEEKQKAALKLEQQQQLQAQQQQQQQPQATAANVGISLQQAMSGKGLSPQQAMGGRELAPVTPPPNRRPGMGMTLDQAMTKQGVSVTNKMGKSASVDEGLSSLATPSVGNAPPSPGFSPRRASMAAVSISVVDETVKPGDKTSKGMSLQEAMASKTGQQQASGGMSLDQAMASKTGQTQMTNPSGGVSLQQAMASKTGQPQRRGPGGAMNLREAMASKTGQNQDRKRGHDSVGDAMAAKLGHQQQEAPRKLMKALPTLPPPDKTKGWEVPRDSIELVTNIGYGTMGPVWKAKAWDIKESEDATSVAIKTLNDGSTIKEREEFLREMELMKKLDPHPYVIGLLGCCTYLDPLYMILEYARHDALLDYLRRNRPGKENARTPTSRIMVNFALQITRGMQYLSKIQLPHGDLTTRNVLLGERMVCKISNFSRERDIAGIVGEPRHAIRWMGVETIATNEYSTMTDIWSFGVLLWEIVTYGATPYPKMHGKEVKSKVPSGYRMEIPSHCGKELYGIMLECWNNEPKKRPSFKSIGIVMQKLLDDNKEYVKAKKYERSKYESPY
ncbi:uncharacterized protein [Amphiura filiformis]|uniref:uncharacterized protein n=1 Tax=Amphiura filiformis TaxID=82378 RepID=UPI003B212465